MEGIRADGALNGAVGRHAYYRAMPLFDPTSAVALSDVLRVAAAGRGGDIAWSLDGSRGLTVDDVDGILALDDDGAFIATAYEAILGRRPDRSGFSVYAGLLKAGMDRTELLLDFVDSIEGRSRPGSSMTRSVLCARRLAPFISAAGSMIDREHLSGSSRIDQVWPFLWVDAVRAVLPDVLEDPADVRAFTTDIAAGRSPRDALVDAWTAGLGRVPFTRRIIGRLRRRLRWHRTWGAIDACFRANVTFYSQLGQIIDGARGGT